MFRTENLKSGMSNRLVRFDRLYDISKKKLGVFLGFLALRGRKSKIQKITLV